jgi:hypothetical protein
MLLAVVYLVMRRILGIRRRLDDERILEMIVLRHQLKILRRQVKRPELKQSDRLLLAAASRNLPRKALVLLHGATGDASTLASGAGPKEVDLPEEAQGRSISSGAQDHKSDPPLSQGEPQMGISTNPGGAG